MGYLEVLVISIGAFFIGGIFGFLMVALCVAGSKNDPDKDVGFLEEENE